jgi:hypothetical protein
MTEGFSSLSSDNLFVRVEQFLASPPFNACLLLVHPQIPMLNAAVEWLVKESNWPVLLVGGVLAKPLLNVAPKRRPSQASRVFTEAISEFEAGPLVCKDIDLLFEPSLHLDPLRLFLNVSRQTTLIVVWPGAYEGHTLAYAVPDHGHYRVWPNPDLCDYCIVNL